MIIYTWLLNKGRPCGEFHVETMRGTKELVRGKGRWNKSGLSVFVVLPYVFRMLGAVGSRLDPGAWSTFWGQISEHLLVYLYFSAGIWIPQWCPIVIQPKIWCQFGIDLIGPMPKTSRGSKNIVNLTDYFSKWAEAAPLKDKGIEFNRMIPSQAWTDCSYKWTC